MNIITGLLESRPGVKSSARLVAIILTALVCITGLVACSIAWEAVFHASKHGESAPLVVSSASTVIDKLMMLMGVELGGLWIALGLRDKAPENSSSSTTTVTQSGAPAAAVTVVPAVVVPAATVQSPAPGVDA